MPTTWLPFSFAITTDMEEKTVCRHTKYQVATKVVTVKLQELESWQMVMKITAICKDCRKPFTFRAKHGFSTSEPTLSNDSRELRIPMDYPIDDDPEIVPLTDIVH